MRSSETMNARERFLIAMRGGIPDRVPCAPDMSNMIPCRLTGKPFWDVYLYENPPLWKAYLQAADYFGIDAWFLYGGLDYQYPDVGVTTTHEIVSRSDDRIVRRTRMDTPAGEMLSETTYLAADPPWCTEKPIKDIQRDFAKFRYLFPVPSGYSAETALVMRREIGGRYAFGAGVGYPGFQWWSTMTEGGLEPLAGVEMDAPGLLEEICALNELMNLKQAEMIIDSGLFDYLLLGGSGSISLASPKLFDKYALPTIQKITRMCKEAGLPTMLHSCGKEAHLVKRCAEETDLSCVNPLEVPPMGDCDLAELKRLYGDRIALMGNIHTTEVMLKGSVEDVERVARQCIDGAAERGGFILSTGDQCGRDTPEANIRKLVEVCQTYGRYA